MLELHEFELARNEMQRGNVCRADDLSHLERSLQQISHIVQMRQQSLGIFVPFAAIRFITIKTESIIKAILLFTCPGNKLFAKIFEAGMLTVCNLEIRCNGTTFIVR